MKRFIRFIQWFFIKKFLVMRISKVESILSYPLIIWVEFGDAKEKFLTHGQEAFNVAYDAKVDELADSLRNALLPDEVKPINERYWSKTQTIARISTEKEEEQREKKAAVGALDELLSKAKFVNGEAKLN